MAYLIDTDTFSAAAKGSSPAASERLNALAHGEGRVSVITLGEVAFGLEHRPVNARMRLEIEALTEALVTLPLGANVIPHYAALRAALKRAGTPIGPSDCWLAAHALAEGLVLVTGNEREFKRVKGLKVENWLR
jgi:tRNA(fMet)-specific endonuclease VapC